VKDLLIKLSALDPDAGAAIKVIDYFDRLVESRAGLEAIVRGAAVLTGCPACLIDEERRVRLRMLPDGRREAAPSAPAPDWPTVTVPGGSATLWLERPGRGDTVEKMVLERAAAAAREVLDRTRGRAPAPQREDPARVELVLDATAPRQARLRAAHELGLSGDAPARAVAVSGGGARIEPAGPPREPRQTDAGPADGRGAADRPEGHRYGVGPAVPIADLPYSWSLARVALRLAAEGTDQDPGPRVVHAEELGGLFVLAGAVGPGTEPVPDVHALEHVGAAAPWMLRTLHAIVSAPSLRAAAAELHLHHSTLQERLAHAERLLGWPVRDPDGRLRLQLAFVLRRLHRHPDPAGR
jgi:hypothetical protein